MDWKNLSPEEKAEFLAKQKEEIRRTRALIERFEQLTEKWLKNAEAQATRKE